MSEIKNTCFPPDEGDTFRHAYAEGINAYLERMNIEAAKKRQKAMNPALQEQYRQALADMLGMQNFNNDTPLSVQVNLAWEDDRTQIWRLSVPITQEIPFYALLLLPKKSQKPMPLIVAQHGGGGTPELCSDLFGKNNYNHMVQRCLDRGACVLAPQLLLWSLQETETMRGHDIPFNRTKVDAQLRRFGSSITALEIAGIRQCLDYACNRTDIDPNRIGMIGLSYGGYFTLHTMALEPRIKAGYSAGAFNSRDKHCLADWSYPSSAFLLQDAEVAALCAPRKLYIQVGKEDTVFDYRSAEAEARQAAVYYKQLGAEGNFQFDLWPGGHTLSDHDEGFDFLFDALK